MTKDEFAALNTIVQAASNIAGGMAGAVYAQSKPLTVNVQQDIVRTSVQIARSIVEEASKLPERKTSP